MTAADDEETPTNSSKEAQQLDSVNNFVQEQELDASKAQQAMDSLTNTNKADDARAAALAAVTVSKEDVAVIVSELEVTEAIADKTLREVATEGHADDMLEAALRRLVTA